MRLIVEARRRAEDLAVCVHELVLVSSDVHGVHRPLQQVQALVAGGLQAVLGRQVGPQGAGQAGVVTQVATLSQRGEKKKVGDWTFTSHPEASSALIGGSNPRAAGSGRKTKYLCPYLGGYRAL